MYTLGNASSSVENKIQRLGGVVSSKWLEFGGRVGTSFSVILNNLYLVLQLVLRKETLQWVLHRREKASRPPPPLPSQEYNHADTV